MTGFPVDFQFSQQSLHDYKECPRRFQLRYLLQVSWPAVVAEPFLEQERRARLGQAFHRLVQQHLTGLPLDRLEALASEEPLHHWWENYLTYRPTETIPGNRYPELALGAALGGRRLMAKFDLLIAGAEGRGGLIFDWKTAERRPKRAILADSLQTRVYRYLLVRAGAPFNGGAAFTPEQVSMIYWFAGYPESPERFDYNQLRYQEDESILKELIAEAVADAESGGDLRMTAREAACRFCVYRSLCGRGVEAGSADEDEEAGGDEGIDEAPLDLNFEQIGEIAF